MKSRALIYAVLFGVFAFGIASSGPAQKKDEEPKKAADADELAKLGKARLQAAAKAYKVWFDVEPGFTGLIYQLSVQWLHAERDLATKKTERIAAYAAHLQRLKVWEAEGPRGAKKNGDENPYAKVTASWRIEAEYWLAKERAGRN